MVIATDELDITLLPDKLVILPKDKTNPSIEFTLTYTLDDYNKQYVTLTELTNAYIKSEQNLHRKMNYAQDSQFLYLFKNCSISSLPANLQKIEQACVQQPYGCYPRFINFLSQLSMCLDPAFIQAVQGRFFSFLCSLKDTDNCAWTYIDFYRLVYYYRWTYLFSVYQTVNPTIEDNKIQI